MSEEKINKEINRRNFLGTLGKSLVSGAAALGSIALVPEAAKADGEYYWSVPQPSPTILPRSAWGAAPYNLSTLRDTSISFALFFHHSGSQIFLSTDNYECASKIYQIQQSHFLVGDGDIGYHYIIDPAGRVWEGRYTTYAGAHITGYNHNIGICVLGNYDKQSLNTLQKNAIKKLAAWRIYLQDIGKSNTWGHNDVDPTTDCPGNELKTFVKGELRTYLNNVIF